MMRNRYFVIAFRSTSKLDLRKLKSASIVTYGAIARDSGVAVIDALSDLKKQYRLKNFEVVATLEAHYSLKEMQDALISGDSMWTVLFHVNGDGTDKNDWNLAFVRAGRESEAKAEALRRYGYNLWCNIDDADWHLCVPMGEEMRDRIMAGDF